MYIIPHVWFWYCEVLYLGSILHCHLEEWFLRFWAFHFFNVRRRLSSQQQVEGKNKRSEDLSMFTVKFKYFSATRWSFIGCACAVCVTRLTSGETGETSNVKRDIEIQDGGVRRTQRRLKYIRSLCFVYYSVGSDNKNVIVFINTIRYD